MPMISQKSTESNNKCIGLLATGHSTNLMQGSHTLCTLRIR